MRLTCMDRFDIGRKYSYDYHHILCDSQILPQYQAPQSDVSQLYSTSANDSQNLEIAASSPEVSTQNSVSASILRRNGTNFNVVVYGYHLPSKTVRTFDIFIYISFSLKA